MATTSDKRIVLVDPSNVERRAITVLKIVLDAICYKFTRAMQTVGRSVSISLRQSKKLKRHNYSCSFSVCNVPIRCLFDVVNGIKKLKNPFHIYTKNRIDLLEYESPQANMLSDSINNDPEPDTHMLFVCDLASEPIRLDSADGRQTLTLEQNSKISVDLYKSMNICFVKFGERNADKYDEFVHELWMAYAKRAHLSIDHILPTCQETALWYSDQEHCYKCAPPERKWNLVADKAPAIHNRVISPKIMGLTTLGYFSHKDKQGEENFSSPNNL